MRRLIAVLLLLAATVSGTADRAHAATRPTRPARHVPAWLSCPDVASLRAARGVVLLVAGTGSKPAESFAWSYEPALAADGFATCTVALPDDALGSFVTSAVRVRKAIRHTALLAGHRISVVGHSQGGALPVWAVKFWPGSARRVDDIVSLAGPFGGTSLANTLCVTGHCSVVAWQLRIGAHTVAALRNARLPTGPHAPSITSVAGRYDEIVSPQPQASHLDGAVNVITQDVCPADPSEHGLILGDPAAYALTLDALTHPGPADPSRVPASTCTQTFIPHGDLAGSVAFGQTLERFAAGLADPSRFIAAEPPLPAYAAPYGG